MKNGSFIKEIRSGKIYFCTYLDIICAPGGLTVFSNYLERCQRTIPTTAASFY